MTRRFLQVDVFGRTSLRGNPLAVVADAQGLSTEDMFSITRWMNLSETAFLLPPEDEDAHYKVRIFTLARELDFAGHPTLGACHAWLALHNPDPMPAVVRQECRAGIVEVRTDSNLAFAAPALQRYGPVSTQDAAIVRDVLRLTADEIVDMSWTDNGPGWLTVLVADDVRVRAVTPDVSAVRALSTGMFDVGIVGPCPPGDDQQFELRALFADDQGLLREDPVTGSLNAAAAQWMVATGRAHGRWQNRQGLSVGRDGVIDIEVDGDKIWVGGSTTTIIDGTFEL